MKQRAYIFFTVLLLGFAICAQTRDSSKREEQAAILTGTVYDIHGSVILHAELLARSFAGKEYQARTNTEGVYKIELPPDVYKIEANAPGFCPKRVEMFRVRKSSQVVERLSARGMPVLPRPLDFVLEVSPSDTPWLNGGRPCKQKTMLKKEPQIRKREIFRSIAE